MSILSGCKTRLYWEPGHGGSATRNGHTIALTEPPDLGRGQVYAVDYVPCAVYSVTRHVGDGHSELEPDEIAAARAIVDGVPSGPVPL